MRKKYGKLNVVQPSRWL